MFKGQFGKAEYSDIAFSITTRIEKAGCFGIIEYNNTSDDLATMVKVIQVGNIIDDTDIGFKNPQRGRIYSPDGLSPCLCDGSGGGGREPKIIEPQVLTPKRTYFGKQVRKQYESGELDMSRHDMTKLEPRTDGVSNTLTSVQKDNLVAEPLRIPQATKQGSSRYLQEVSSMHHIPIPLPVEVEYKREDRFRLHLWLVGKHLAIMRERNPPPTASANSHQENASA